MKYFIPKEGAVVESCAPSSNNLEVSSRSGVPEGRALSAMFLRTRSGYTVEGLYQGSKVFANGGPYLLPPSASGFEAKAYARRMAKGSALVGFRLPGAGSLIDFHKSIEVYNYIYLAALAANPKLESFILQFESFSDCFYRPGIFACQARSCALFVALHSQGVQKPWMWARETLGL